MKKNKTSVIITSFILAMLILVGCSQSGSSQSGSSQSGNEFIGKWHDNNVDCTITRSGNQYVLDIKNPRGMIDGTYTGTYDNGTLKVSSGLIGSVSHLQNEDVILIAGAKLQRVK
jgi:major membrane immunogen (membrane-anchored lipoprotein)